MVCREICSVTKYPFNPRERVSLMFKEAVSGNTVPYDLQEKKQRIFVPLRKSERAKALKTYSDEGILKPIPLFGVSNSIKRLNPICKAINAGLPVVSVLLFGAGIYRMFSVGIETGYEFYGWLFYGLLVFSIALHEAGHLAAGIAYGFKIEDIGLLRLWLIPIGAYVGYGEKDGAARAERVQFSLAGIEMNLLVAGICLFAAMLYYPLSFTFLLTARMNVLLAAINLLPAFEFDGESVLSDLLGIEDLGKTAKAQLFNRKHRRKLLRSGLRGAAHFCVYTVVLLSEGLVWLIFGFDIFSVIYSLI